MLLPALLTGCLDEDAETDAGSTAEVTCLERTSADCQSPKPTPGDAGTDASTDAAMARRDAAVLYEDDGGTTQTFSSETGQCVTDLVCETPACEREQDDEVERLCNDGWKIVDASWGDTFTRYHGRCGVQFTDYYSKGKLVARRHTGNFCGGNAAQLIEGDARFLRDLDASGIPWAKGAQDGCAKFRDGGLSWVDAGSYSCP